MDFWLCKQVPIFFIQLGTMNRMFGFQCLCWLCHEWIKTCPWAAPLCLIHSCLAPMKQHIGWGWFSMHSFDSHSKGYIVGFAQSSTRACCNILPMPVWNAKNNWNKFTQTEKYWNINCSLISWLLYLFSCYKIIFLFIYSSLHPNA